MAGLLKKIKQESARTGGNKKKLLWVPKDGKKRIRFLQEIDDGLEVQCHDSYSNGIDNTLCLKEIGKDCPYCDDEDIRKRSMFVWSVYDYDANEVKLAAYAFNQCTPVSQFMAYAEHNGTITDRDYILTKTGSATDTSYAMMPQDRRKIKNTKIKPFSKQQTLKILTEAWSFKGEVEESDGFDDINSPEESEYTDMSKKELYELCVERELDVPKKPADAKKKPSTFFIRLLEEADQAEEDWNDEDDTEDWDDESDGWDDEDFEDDDGELPWKTPGKKKSKKKKK